MASRCREERCGKGPRDEDSLDEYARDSRLRQTKTRAKFGHFLKGSVAAFDAPFFSITPAEASNMDPQQRGMLESVYKALENGRYLGILRLG